MADATELLSLANLKVYLQITSSDKDAILTDIKDFVEDFCKKYTGKDFLVTSYTIYRDGDNTRTLNVEQYPITAITSIHKDANRSFGSDTLIPTASIITNDSESWASGIIELYDDTFTRGIKNIKVILSAGYSTIPQDLQFAVAEICARVYTMQDKRLFGQITQTVGQRTLSLDMEALPKRAKATLDRYRSIRL